LHTPYLCDEHEVDLCTRTAVRAARRSSRGRSIIFRPRLTLLRPHAMTDDERLECPVCGARVNWEDAVATQGDQVVHARCHRAVLRFRATSDSNQ
jgi:hypothetical protein